MMKTRVDTILRILGEYGLSGNGELHAWRCAYPDRYGECTCVMDLALDIAAALDN
jgi:hypothetical protein